jgi:hypothetical protein
VRPDLAVIALLDQPAGSLVQQAVLASEPDTGYAILVNSARSSDAERSGSAQLVGRALRHMQHALRHAQPRQTACGARALVHRQQQRFTLVVQQFGIREANGSLLQKFFSRSCHFRQV